MALAQFGNDGGGVVVARGFERCEKERGQWVAPGDLARGG